MPSEPFPDRGPGDPEPQGSAPRPAPGSAPRAATPVTPAADLDEFEITPEWLADDLTAEEISQAGFGDGGMADQMAPGPVLSGLVHAATRDEKILAALSEDELIGVIAAAQRTERRAAWAAMAATREYAARHAAAPLTSRGCSGADELACKLNMTWQAAGARMNYARNVAARLPKAFAALKDGKAAPAHVRIIEDETSILSPEDAAQADEKLAEAAESKTFAQLRNMAHRLVLRLDPDAGRRRKERARQDAYVRRFREDSGNAGMVAHELPADEVLASWQHVEQRALDLRAAGVPGTLQELRVRAYLDLLQERDARTVLPPPAQARAPQDGTAAQDGPDEPGGTGDGPGGNGGSGPGRGPSGPAGTGPDGPEGPGGNTRQPGRDTGPSIAAQVTITVPLSTLQGDSDTPGEAAGFGLLDGDTARDLAAAAARNSDTRWCVTALHPDGTAAAHACARGPHPGPPDPSQLKFTTVIRGPCDHVQAQQAYRPSRKLRHLVNARSACCTAPGCSQPATRCDLDHTKPWHHGGPTCSCNLAPPCMT